MTAAAENFTVVRFSALPGNSATLIAAVRGGVPAPLARSCSRGHHAPLFSIVSDTRWASPGKFDRVEVVQTPGSSDTFVLRSSETASVYDWLDAALPGWRAMKNAYGFPCVSITNAARDPEYQGEMLVAWLANAERQSERFAA